VVLGGNISVGVALGCRRLRRDTDLSGVLLEVLSNHVVHLQGSLDEITEELKAQAADAKQQYEHEEAHQAELVRTLNSNKDAVVQAIIASRK
jgi:hypothetical protein